MSNRVGFNLTKFVGEAGLGIPVAANWFLVSAPNVTTSSVGSAGTGAASGTGSSAAAFTQTSGAVGFKGVGIVGVFVCALGFALCCILSIDARILSIP